MHDLDIKFAIKIIIVQNKNHKIPILITTCVLHLNSCMNSIQW